MPFVIAPSPPLALNIEDKDGNGVYRLICYKPQSEDVIKALRKKGYTSRTFVYDKNAWQSENTERSLLKENVANLTTTLMRSAAGSFQ